MTDAERQHLREHFLEPETRCDFFVDEKRKQLWKCMLDMLEILDRTCKEHGLRYFLFYGSLLGAIRHKGFIPWDDDLDVVMPRPDFDRIQKILEKELEPPYFLQNFKTDPGFASSYFKIRNSQTAAITPFFVKRHISANLGIFIDVHSVDGLPNSHFVLKTMEKLRFLLKVAMYTKVRWPIKKASKSDKAFARLLSIMFGRAGLHGLTARLSRLYSFGNTESVGITPAFYGYNPPKHVFPVSWFSEDATSDFEYLQVSVPKQNNEILAAEYGDWHQFVRGVEGGARHDWMRYDTQKDFKTLLVEEFGYSGEELAAVPTSNHSAAVRNS